MELFTARRMSALRMLAASPHLDDAALSVGQTLLGLGDAYVLTVLAGEPPTGHLTPCPPEHVWWADLAR